MLSPARQYKINAIKSWILCKIFLFGLVVSSVSNTLKHIALFKFSICFGLNVFILQQYYNEFFGFFIMQAKTTENDFRAISKF